MGREYLSLGRRTRKPIPPIRRYSCLPTAVVSLHKEGKEENCARNALIWQQRAEAT